MNLQYQLSPSYNFKRCIKCEKIRSLNNRSSQSRKRRIQIACFFGQKQKVQVAPRPHEKFSKKDLIRIRKEGPSLEDLVYIHNVTLKSKGEVIGNEEHIFVPPTVLGTNKYNPEPDWLNLPQISLPNFYHALRQRNWTCKKYFDINSDPWDLKIYEDSGRFMRPAFSGYRVLVTNKNTNAQFWVDMPEAGQDSFMRDYMSGGTRGGIYKAKRLAQPNYTVAQIGYNQVFEQIFQAYEQYTPQEIVDDMYTYGFVPKEKMEYFCPSDHYLTVSYNLTPNEFSLAAFWSQLPYLAAWFSAISFTFICVVYGIFRSRKQMPADPMEAIEFAQSKGQARKDGTTDVTFANVAALDAIRQELMEIVEFLKNPERYGELNARPPKGVLLEGDPGTGKTLIAKAIAGEAKVPFYQMSGSEFVEAIVGVGAARVRDLFARAKVNSPCVVFVDEIDAMGIKRAEAGVKTNEEREQTLNQLLSEMDGFTPGQGVVFVAATNRADLLDPALMRAGRFDRKIRIRKPQDDYGRFEILKVHARRFKIQDDVNLMQLAKNLPGLSGAELANVLNEAALEAARSLHKEIDQADVDAAVDRMLQGIRRPALPDFFKSRRIIATHEIGRAIVATIIYNRYHRIEQVDRVSVVPRGSGWSRTLFNRSEDEDFAIVTRGHLVDRIRITLAGRAAEYVALEPELISTYAAENISQASKIAERIVAHFGLSSVGITTYAAAASESGSIKQVSNWDRSMAVTEEQFGSSVQGGLFQPSDPTVNKIKMETAKIVTEAFYDCVEILVENIEALKEGTELVLEKEQMYGVEIQQLIDKHSKSAAAV